MIDLRQLRSQIRAQRRAIDDDAQRQAAAMVAERLIERGRSWRRVGAYLAADGELDLDPTVTALEVNGCEVCVPVVTGDSMVFVALGPDTEWTLNRFAIREPVIADDRSNVVAVADLDAVIAPAVAVTLTGQRVGMGGGFYDRTFADPSTRPLLIAAVHDLQVVDRLEAAVHDVPVDAVVTPTRWVDALTPF